MTKKNIGFIGGGNMTRAIAGGLVDSGFDATQLFIAEPDATARKTLAEAFPASTITADNEQVMRTASSVVLAVKPQVLPAVCRKLTPSAQAARPLVISIAAGVRSANIDSWLGGGLPIVRVMPNQPALIRRGISGVYANPNTSAAQVAHAVAILEAVGKVVTVSREADIDTVTAVSGSGPAYFFLLIDMLADAGVELGLDADAAASLAIETACGAAELAAREPLSMQELIRRVRSPGGTTEAALDSLDAANVRAIFACAVKAARDRAVVLADDAHNNQST